MFGYIVCNRNELTEEENNRYEQIYCGVCKALGKRYGQIERLSISYDMTFLALLLSALYEPIEKEDEFRCLFCPFCHKTAIGNKYIDYAADMGIVLTYYKCLDDWKDDKNVIQFGYGKMLEKNYRMLEEKYPRQCNTVRTSLGKLVEEENTKAINVDKVINYSGLMLSELFVYEEDYWSETLRWFGYELGRFIYLMEAIGRVTKSFEVLPIIRDESIIKNVLYSGVWQKYNTHFGKEKKYGK